jgi:hypothetical protein
MALEDEGNRRTASAGVVTAIVAGFVAVASGAMMLAGCQCVDASWVDSYYPGTDDIGEERQHATTTGLVACKNVGLSGNFGGPTNGFDDAAVIFGLLAPIVGLVSSILLCTTYWQCCCICCCHATTRVVAILFGTCCLAQLLTLLILASAACSDKYDGECVLLWNGYVSIVASALYLVCAALVYNASLTEAYKSDKQQQHQEGEPQVQAAQVVSIY